MINKNKNMKYKIHKLVPFFLLGSLLILSSCGKKFLEEAQKKNLGNIKNILEGKLAVK